jgi:hypothetical protein
MGTIGGCQCETVVLSFIRREGVSATVINLLGTLKRVKVVTWAPEVLSAILAAVGGDLGNLTPSAPGWSVGS